MQPIPLPYIVGVVGLLLFALIYWRYWRLSGSLNPFAPVKSKNRQAASGRNGEQVGGNEMTANTTANPDTLPKKSSWRNPVVSSVIFMLVVVGGLAAVIILFSVLGFLKSLELQMAMVVVLAIAALLAMLSIAAIIYNSQELADGNQALGLPEGSIRALIALFLLMIFIIMSVYLFRTITTSELIKVPNLSFDQVTALAGQLPDGEQLSIGKNASGTYDVTIGVAVSAGAQQVALQLITVLGTLVTAVSAFYFGSTTATSAAEKAAAAASGTGGGKAAAQAAAQAAALPLHRRPGRRQRRRRQRNKWRPRRQRRRRKRRRRVPKQCQPARKRRSLHKHHPPRKHRPRGHYTEARTHGAPAAVMGKPGVSTEDGRILEPYYGIFGPDDRQIYWPDPYPWGCIGRIFTWNDFSQPNWTWWGSGALVGPRMC